MPTQAVTLQNVNDATPWIGNDLSVCDAVFQIIGAFGGLGTITFEACLQGQEANATPIGVSAVASPGTLVTTATAPGIFKTNQGFAGGLKVRARVTVGITNPVQVVCETADAR